MMTRRCTSSADASSRPKRAVFDFSSRRGKDNNYSYRSNVMDPESQEETKTTTCAPICHPVGINTITTKNSHLEMKHHLKLPSFESVSSDPDEYLSRPSSARGPSSHYSSQELPRLLALPKNCRNIKLQQSNNSNSPRILSTTPRLRTPTTPRVSPRSEAESGSPRKSKFTGATPSGFSFSRSDLGGVDSVFFSQHNVPVLNTVNWLVPDCLAFGAFPFNKDLIQKWKTRDGSVLNYDSYEPYTDMDRSCKYIASKFDVIVNLVPRDEFEKCQFEPSDYQQVLNQFRRARPQWIAASPVTPRRQAPPDIIFLDRAIQSSCLLLSENDTADHCSDNSSSGGSGSSSSDNKSSNHLKLDETYRLLEDVSNEIVSMIVTNTNNMNTNNNTSNNNNRKRVLIHSVDGTSRAPIIAGLVMSKIYNMERESTIVRLQATHDCRSETFKRQLVIGDWIQNILEMFPPSATLLSSTPPTTPTTHVGSLGILPQQPFVDLGISTPRACPRVSSSPRDIKPVSSSPMGDVIVSPQFSSPSSLACMTPSPHRKTSFLRRLPSAAQFLSRKRVDVKTSSDAPSPASSPSFSPVVPKLASAPSLLSSRSESTLSGSSKDESLEIDILDVDSESIDSDSENDADTNAGEQPTTNRTKRSSSR